MGSSSKKHKGSKKRKRSRSHDRERHHSSHKRHKSHKHKRETVEYISSDSSDVEEVLTPPPPIISAPPPPRIDSENVSELGDGKSKESLSIQETNALRAKLGLKPLQVESTPVTQDRREKRIAEDGTDMGEFVHKPATNISQKVKAEKLREKLAVRKEKRAIDEKLKSIKGLGESDTDDDDAKGWVNKSRERELQRKQAEKREKLLEELDTEFGIGALVEEERRNERKDLYTSRDLRGLRVGHSTDGFQEGANVILTLKDSAVLEDGPDTLINVNMIDNERYKKNVERKMKKKVDDDDMDVDPFDRKTSVLAKYDEEIDGEKEDNFALGEEISEEARIKKKLSIRNKLMQKTAVDLNTTTLRLASDYFTEDEAHAKFKKPGKFKKLRKKPKPLKADDLLPKEEVLWPSEDLGCRRRKPRITTSDMELLDMDIVKDEIEPILDVDDMPEPPDDLYNIKLEPDEAELELQLALNKTRKIKQKLNKNVLVEMIAKDIRENASEHSDELGGNICLNSTAEFCRTLGDIPTYGLSGNREEEEELLDFEREMKEESLRWEEERKNRGAWSQVANDEEKTSEVVPEDVAILDEEPDVGKGIAGALRLAISKGYLEKETTSGRPSASRFAHLQAQNYSIEDKAHGDDDKFGRRDRFAGPTSDFKEKDNYKPNVKLDYIDDDGHILNAKEAFRYLSHKFHGKGPGKNKVEKRMKKNEQEGLMKQMSSTDTPLRTLTMLQQKQKETQSAFVILSGKGQSGSSSTISKSK